MLSVGRRPPGLLILVAWLSIACASLSAPRGDSLLLGSQAAAASLVASPSPDASDQARQQSPAEHTARFERLSIEQGLSQSSVYSIYQDSAGFIWAGTQDGLNKFDGYRFTHFKPAPGDANSLSNNNVLAIYEDREGALWVGTNGGGLNRYDRKQDEFVRYQHDSRSPYSLSNNVVWSIYQDRLGELWVGTAYGLNRYDWRNDRFIRYYGSQTGSGPLGNSVRAIFEDRQGALWFGTEDGGLSQLDRERRYFRHYQRDPGDPNSLGSNMVTSICDGQDGALWIGTEDSGLIRFDPASGHFDHYLNNPDDPGSLGGNSVQTVYRDRDGTLWVGTDGAGLNRFDELTGQFIRYTNKLDDPHSLSDDWVRSIFEDQAGNLWVGTLGGGMNRLERASQPFTSYRPALDEDNSMAGDLVWALYEDRSGLLWVGTLGGGLNALDRRSGRWEHYQYDPADPHSLSNNTVRAILEDRQGRLWIGTEGGGLNRFDRENGQFIHYRHDPKDSRSLSSDMVLTLYEDASGVLWVGTAGGGLNQADPASGHFTRYPPQGDSRFSLGNGNVRAIYEDRQGVLWVGTDGGGLNCIDRQRGRFTYYRFDPNDPASLSGDNIMSIYEDRSGVLWVGTFGEGLNKFDRQSGSFEHFTTLDGLPNDVIYGILEDEQGFLWLSTNKGLSRFDPLTETFHNYDTSDGLQCNEFNAGAYHKSSSGEMFFGGVQGFSSFYPAWMQENPYAPPVVLTSITQGGVALEPGRAVESVEAVTLRWPSNYFEFEFAALNFSRPEKNQYAYKLEKFDKGWNYVGTTRVGRYTNLPGGNYTLRVKGSNNDGVWNEQGVSLQVTVVPPVWATWWFRAAALLLLVLGLLAGYRLRLRSLEARSRQLEAQVQERTFEIERRRQVAEGLREILEMLNSERSIRESLDYIACQAAQLSGANEVLIYHYSGSGAAALAGCLSDQAQEFSSGAPTPANWVTLAVQRGEPLVVTDIDQEADRMGELPALLRPYGALLGLPLLVGGEVYGGMVLLFSLPRAFSGEDIDLGRSFAEHAALAIANEQLRLRAKRVAVAAERNRLALELHDSAKQKAFAALAQLGAANGLIERQPQIAREHVLEAETLVHEVLQEMVALIQEMRPAALKEKGLAAALREYASEWSEQSGIAVELKVEDGQARSPEVEQAFYRIAQEALANVARHSQARRVEILLAKDSRLSRMSIVDDGCGFDPGRTGDGLGLRSMRERAEMHGGKLRLESAPGQGTRLYVEIAIQEGQSEHNERSN
ncbi:MAG: GAF domain-containing protein [Anaerolineales bacterium]|nr:GAF domain-containing protein [Anaerolineales bacterium]